MRELGSERVGTARGTGTAVLACVSVVLACVSAVPRSSAAGPDAIPTFESIGLYWSPAEGSSERAVAVRFRRAGTESWSTGQPLWFDARTSPSPPHLAGGEYRGSVVGLSPGTSYDVELSLAGGPTTVLQVTTWSDVFPVGETVTLPASSAETLVIDRSGNPTGYLLYTPAPGKPAVIDVANARDFNIEIKGSYVIVRGLTLKGARRDAIRLDKTGTVTDVVIEENDISGWGGPDGSGPFGAPFQAAIRVDSNPNVSRLVIQRNRIHQPRFDSNSWCERRSGEADPGCNTHPDGPHGILLTDSGGHHVIRYNTLETDDEHYFTDGIGGGTFGYAGFPTRDSDVYGNYIERCWDNPIEAEGGNRNVRIWGNYIDRSYSPIAITPVSLGPLYVWRNVVDVTRRGPPAVTGDSDQDPRGRFLKAGEGERGGGRVYVYHNTIFQRPPPDGRQKTLGASTGVITTASSGDAYNMIVRNNVLHVVDSDGTSIQDDADGTNGRRNDFDYDLYNGRLYSPLTQEAHGIRGAPLYDTGNGRLEFFLAASGPGVDAGVVLPNFNDDFDGGGPDVGAFERNRPPLLFGAPVEPPLPPQDLAVQIAP